MQSQINFFTILHFLMQEYLNAMLLWLEYDDTRCDQIVSGLNFNSP
jgi:hypothetical protein